MGLVVLIPIVFSIFNVVENSNLKHKVSTLEANLESEAENVKSLEAKLELEIETREHENETLSDAIENIKSFVNYTGM